MERHNSISERNNCQSSLLYPAKLSFIIEGFHNKQKLKEFMTIKPSMQKITKRILQRKKENRHNQKNARINTTGQVD
jgi:predicted choloylglycine hydrolase